MRTHVSLLKEYLLKILLGLLHNRDPLLLSTAAARHVQTPCLLLAGKQIAMAPLRPPMKGELFCYAPGRVAFESLPTLCTDNNIEASTIRNKCILLGGLSDGLMPVPYTVNLLEEACYDPKDSWSLIQPILSSSYLGFGHGSLDNDVAELGELISHLAEDREASCLAIVGHSTGTQDIVHFLKHGRPDLVAMVQAVALQAPVSDREAATVCDGACHTRHEEHMQDLNTHLAIAQKMRDENQSQEMMPRKAFWAPITAARYLDLFEMNGRDDYFSSDLTDEQLAGRLGHIGALTTLQSCLVACSGSDEYVPKTVAIESLMLRLCSAMNSGGERTVALPLYLPTGNHNLSSENGTDATTFVAKFKELLMYCTQNCR